MFSTSMTWQSLDLLSPGGSLSHLTKECFHCYTLCSLIILRLSQLTSIILKVRSRASMLKLGLISFIKESGKTGYQSPCLAEKVLVFTCLGTTQVGILSFSLLIEHLDIALVLESQSISTTSSYHMHKAVLSRLQSGWSPESLQLLYSVRVNG